jgi:hypothetical protein
MEGFEDLVGYSSSKLVDGLQVLKKGLSPRMLEIYNVRYVLSRYGRAPIDGIRTETVHASPEDDLTITRLLDARPRAYWSGSYRLTRDEAEALAVLRAPEGGDVITIQAGPGLTEATTPEPVPLRPAAISHYEPDRVVIRVDAPSEGWLVLSDRHDPAWAATVDGRETPIHRANVMVRAVRVPAGSHEVVFTYRPPVVAWGIAVTLLGWLGASLWWAAAWLSWRATPRTSRVGIDDTGAPS